MGGAQKNSHAVYVLH